MMGGTEHDQRLDRLVADARAQPLPRLNVEGLRESLLAEFRAVMTGRAPGSIGVGARGRLRRVVSSPWLSVAAACVVGLGLSWQFIRPRLSSSEGRGSDTAALGPVRSHEDGASLELGEPVVAEGVPLRVEHAARATWVLAPGSRARLLSDSGDALRVELDRGTLDARVEPSQTASSFVVQAGGTEVSVHGTRFQVSLEGERAEVIVTEGEVRVSPLGQEGGTALRAGMQAKFRAGVVQADSLQMVSDDVVAAANEALGQAPVLSAAGAPAEGVRSATGKKVAPARPLSSPPEEPAAGSLTPAAPPAQDAVTELALRRVSERIQSCFRQHTEARGELRIEAATRLGLWVQPNGLILEVGLDPPLAPPVEQCVATELAQLNLGPSPEGYRVDREIRLSR